MITRMSKGLLAPLLVCLMTACSGGGGGGSSNTTPPPTGNNPPPTTPPTTTPTAEDVANARSSELKASLRADTNELTITWKDAFAAETGYTVEARAADGTWQVLESLPAGQATGTAYEWQRVINASTTYRVRATRDGYSVPLEIAADVPQIAVNLNSQMAIEVDPAPPVSGPVRLSIENPVDVQAVTYYLDTQTINTSNTAPDFALNWNSIEFTDGEHLLQAAVQQTSGVSVELRRAIVVDNPATAISFDVFARDLGRLVAFAGLATAEAGIQQLEFFANGAPIQVLSASGQTRFNYDFHLPRENLPGGTVTFRVVATDTNGLTVEATDQYEVDKTPQLTLTTPANGALVRNTLRLEGTFSEDVSTATVTARLGDVVIMQLPPQASGSFQFDYSLAGFPAGEYTLTVNVLDEGFQGQTVTRRVIVPASQAVYELVASNVAKLLATDEGAVLYQKTDGSVILRNAAGVETTLPVPSGFYSVSNWQLDGGYVVMSGVLASNTYHVYAFTPTGQVRNLSLQSGSEMNSTPKLKSPWVTWYRVGAGNDPDYFHLYNLTTDAVTVVAHPAGLYSVSTDTAMVTTPGAEQFFFTGFSGATDRNDVFRYDLQTQTTDMLTAGEAQHTYLQTDNTRLAVLRGLWGSYELFTAPVTNATTLTSLGPILNVVPKLRDGLVVYNAASGIKANDGTTTMDVGSAGTVYSVADGRVLFNESPPKLLTWSAAGGKQMLLNTLPISALHDGNSAFITTGTSDSMLLYRITLP